MIRRVEPELLDELPDRDPRALRSRSDIGRINAVMGHTRILARELQNAFNRHLFFRMVELGGGGGEFMLAVARRLRGRWRGVHITVVDRKDVLSVATRECFADLNWQVRLAMSDALEWLRDAEPERPEAIVANLFLHQFDDARLREMLAAIADRTRLLIAIEPRRWRPALFFCRGLWLLGCNFVTRHDARVSVRAGFAGRELSALWPDKENWELTEGPVNWSSHLFIARHKEMPAPSVFQPIVSAVFDRTAAAAPAPLSPNDAVR